MCISDYQIGAMLKASAFPQTILGAASTLVVPQNSNRVYLLFNTFFPGIAGQVTVVRNAPNGELVADIGAAMQPILLHIRDLGTIVQESLLVFNQTGGAVNISYIWGELPNEVLRRPLSEIFPSWQK